MSRQEFITRQLSWLNENGNMINSCQFDYAGTTISFSKHSSGVWTYYLG